MEEVSVLEDIFQKMIMYYLAGYISMRQKLLIRLSLYMQRVNDDFNLHFEGIFIPCVVCLDTDGTPSP